MKIYLPASLSVFIAFAATVAGRADTVILTTADGGGADAYVQGSFSGTNFGLSGVLTTRNNAGNAANNYKTYLRFDLRNFGLDLPNATSVSLQLASLTSRSGVAYSFSAIPDSVTGDAPSDWTESGTGSVTYDNAPGNATSTTDLGFIASAPGDENGAYLTPIGTLSGLMTSGTGGVFSFSSAGLLSLIRADTNGFVTIAIRRTDTGSIVQLASKENVFGYAIPTLVIDAPLVPEPSSALLLCAGLALLATRRRRTIR